MAPELEPLDIGQSPDLDDEPVILPVVARDLDGEPHTHNLRCRPAMPFGRVMGVYRSMKKVTRDGKTEVVVDTDKAMAFITDCIMEDDRDAWEEFVSREDLQVTAEQIGVVYNFLRTYYVTPHPRTQRPPSSNGSTSPEPIGPDAATEPDSATPSLSTAQ